MKNMRFVRALIAAAACAFAAPAPCAWESQVINPGGVAGEGIAISSQTSRVYVPLIQQTALSVVEPHGATSRIELDVRPTNVGYSAATGRLFVLAGFDNAVVVIEEGSGAMTRLAVGTYPDKVLVDDVRGKVYVSAWGGHYGSGGITVIDARSLAVRNLPLGKSVVAMAQDTETGHLFVTTENSNGPWNGGIMELNVEGRVVASAPLGYRAYSLAVDSRTGRIYAAGLSAPPPFAVGKVDRIFRVYTSGLRLVKEHVWPAGNDWLHLVFAIDPSEPGLYFGSSQNDMVFRLDVNGDNLRAWRLQAHDGAAIKGVFEMTGDPVTGNLFVRSNLELAEFNPRTAATDYIPAFGTLRFWSDPGHLLVVGGQLWSLKREAK